MFLKKFSSFTLFLGILSSITCQGVSGAGENCGGKSGYIYVEDGGQSNENIGYKEAEGEEEVEGKKGSLVSRVKNKLKQAKDFVYQNPVKVGAVGLAAAVTPVLAYAGYKIKQNYFGEKDVDLAKDVQTDEENKGAEVNKEVPGSDKVSENKEVATNLPVNEENPPEGQDSGRETKPPVEEEQSKPSDSNKEAEKNTEPDSNIVDPAIKGTDLNSSANTNAEDENENTNENLKSVFLGVYSDLLVYLLLKLTPQSWGLQKGWYNLWHYKDGRLAHPFKLLMLGLLSWVNLVILIFGLYSKVNENIKEKECGEIKYNIGVVAFSAASPNVALRIILLLMGDSPKERVLGGILGPAFWLFTEYNKNENNVQ